MFEGVYTLIGGLKDKLVFVKNTKETYRGYIDFILNNINEFEVGCKYNLGVEFFIVSLNQKKMISHKLSEQLHLLWNHDLMRHVTGVRKVKDKNGFINIAD